MIDLKDLRAKVTPEADAALESVSRVTGKDRSEIVREILHDWASQKIDEASVLHRLLVAEGLPGIVQGTAGKMGA